MHTEYETTAGRAAKALLIGALLGPGLVAVGFLPWAGAEFVLVYIVAFVVFGIGLLVMGAPLWAIFHALRWRSAPTAAGLGFVATFVTCAFLFGGLNGGGQVFVFAGLVAIAGAAVGFVIRQVAYRPSIPDAQQHALFLSRCFTSFRNVCKYKRGECHVGA